MTSASHSDAPAPSVGRRLLGVLLTLFLVSSTASVGAEIGAEGVAWSAFAVTSGLLLLAAAWHNWPMLWNLLGRTLRSLLGERGARIALGGVAIVFTLSSLLGSIVQ